MNEADKKTILIVDDSVVARKMIKSFLENKYAVLEAESSRECLKMLADSKPKIDLGLIDVVMPEMDGFQLVKLIKKHPSYANAPFIMVTTSLGKENVERAVLAGACSYITKPFEKETLLQKISEHLKEEPASAEKPAQDEVKPNEAKAEPVKDGAK